MQDSSFNWQVQTGGCWWVGAGSDLPHPPLSGQATPNQVRGEKVHFLSPDVFERLMWCILWTCTAKNIYYS